MNKYQEALNNIIKELHESLGVDIAYYHETYNAIRILQKLIDQHKQALELLDEVHQAMYPLVTLYDRTGISGNSAIKINKFKQKIDWKPSKKGGLFEVE